MGLRLAVYCNVPTLVEILKEHSDAPAMGVMLVLAAPFLLMVCFGSGWTLMGTRCPGCEACEQVPWAELGGEA
jgi:hypothetical protein